MNCPQCLADNDLDMNRCWKCGSDLVSRAALSSADLVRVQRVGRLAARWREEAAKWKEIVEKAAAMKVEYPEALAKQLTYEACADALETEWAGSGPTK